MVYIDESLLFQTAHDHAALLILVRHLGSKLNPRNFSRVYERISRQNSFRIKDSSGNMRVIYPRFVKSYPIENNDWGDFQVKCLLTFLIDSVKNFLLVFPDSSQGVRANLCW